MLKWDLLNFDAMLSGEFGCHVHLGKDSKTSVKETYYRHYR
jgi:hypothetical protein